jgi:hypothetical protein
MGTADGGEAEVVGAGVLVVAIDQDATATDAVLADLAFRAERPVFTCRHAERGLVGATFTGLRTRRIGRAWVAVVTVE